MASAPSCSKGHGRKLLKKVVRSQRERESVSSASVSSEEASEELLAEMSEGGGIFGKLGRMSDTWRAVSRTSSEQREEASAASFESSGMLITSSWTDLSLNCSPTDMTWFDSDHVSGLSRSFDECHGYPSPILLHSSSVSSASFIPCSCRPNPFPGVYLILRRISHGFFMWFGT